MIFSLTDDSRATKKLVDDFAKKYGCNIVEVWYRFDNDWENVIPYKVYTYYRNIDGDTLRKITG